MAQIFCQLCEMDGVSGLDACGFPAGSNMLLRWLRCTSGLFSNDPIIVPGDLLMFFRLQNLFFVSGDSASLIPVPQPEIVLDHGKNRQDHQTSLPDVLLVVSRKSEDIP